jgi:hypothetical protein
MILPDELQFDYAAPDFARVPGAPNTRVRLTGLCFFAAAFFTKSVEEPEKSPDLGV